MEPTYQTSSTEIEARLQASESEHGGWFLVLGRWIAAAQVVVLALLGLRLALMMTDANRQNDFVEAIFRMTGPLVHPFAGIMRNRSLDSGGTLEPATLIAMGVYVLAAAFIVFALWMLAPREGPSRESFVRRRRIVHQH